MTSKNKLHLLLDISEIVQKHFCLTQAEKIDRRYLRHGQTVKNFGWQATLKCLTNNVWSFAQGP